MNRSHVFIPRAMRGLHSFKRGRCGAHKHTHTASDGEEERASHLDPSSTASKEWADFQTGQKDKIRPDPFQLSEHCSIEHDQTVRCLAGILWCVSPFSSLRFPWDTSSGFDTSGWGKHQENCLSSVWQTPPKLADQTRQTALLAHQQRSLFGGAGGTSHTQHRGNLWEGSHVPSSTSGSQDHQGLEAMCTQTRRPWISENVWRRCLLRQLGVQANPILRGARFLFGPSHPDLQTSW